MKFVLDNEPGYSFVVIAQHTKELRCGDRIF